MNHDSIVFVIRKIILSLYSMESLIIILMIFFLQRDVIGLPILRLTISELSSGNINLTCTSDQKPFGDAAEYLVDGKTYNNVRRFNKTCYRTKEGAKCLTDTCACSNDGRSYSLVYKTKKENGVIKFGCSMKYFSDSSSNIISVSTEMLFEVADSKLPQTIATDISTKSEHSSEIMMTAVICNNKRLNFSSPFYNMCQEAGDQSGNLILRILEDIDGNECLCFFNKMMDKTKGSWAIVIYMTICLGTPVILLMIVVSCIQAIRLLKKGSPELQSVTNQSNNLLYEVTSDDTDMHVYLTTDRPYEDLSSTNQSSHEYNILDIL